MSAYMFIAAGEVFAVSASYEVAFAIAPKEQKHYAPYETFFDFWSRKFHLCRIE